MAFNNSVDTLTNNYLTPQIVDTVLRTNSFATAMLSKTKKFGSSTVLMPIKYQKGIAGTSFSGFDTLPTSAQNTRVNLTYNPRFYAVNIALPGTDIVVNNTPEKVLDLATVEMRSRAQDMADDIGTLFYGDGTGNGNKDFNGLGSIVDDGSTAPTIGGLSRSVYPTLDSTVTASGGTLSLAKLRALYNNIMDLTVQPTSNYMPYTVSALYELLLQPQERIMKDVQMAKNFKGFDGFKTMEYLGMPVISDRKATTGVWFMLNEDYLDFYAVDGWSSNGMTYEAVPLKYEPIIGNSYNEVNSLGFYWSGWVRTVNAVAVNSYMVLGGDLITDNPRRHGKLTGLTGV